MSLALKPYLDCIKATLQAALCLENFASQIVERHNKPEIEVGASKELLLNPIVIHRSEYEKVMIETAVNAVRFSIKVKQIDEMDAILANKFSRFLMQRADNFIVLRRKPMPVSTAAPSVHASCHGPSRQSGYPFSWGTWFLVHSVIPDHPRSHLSRVLPSPLMITGLRRIVSAYQLQP